MALLVRCLAATYYDGHHIEPHAHPWGQLIYAASGVMRVSAQGRLWIVPPSRAVWAPAGVRHEIWARGDFAMRSVYLAPEIAAGMASDCRAVDVPPLLRELILHAVSIQLLDGEKPAHRALIEVLTERIAAAETLPLMLPLPRDRRAVAAAERLRADPSATAELKDIAQAAGAGVRTLQRLFLEETGLRFSDWRRRLRLLHALAQLGGGASVTTAGLEAGYASTSAFVAAFRREFGHTPTAYRLRGGRQH